MARQFTPPPGSVPDPDELKDSEKSMRELVSLFHELIDSSSQFGKSLSKDVTKNLTLLAKTTDILTNNISKLVVGQLREKDIMAQINKSRNTRLNVERQIKIAVEAQIIDAQLAAQIMADSVVEHEQLLKALHSQQEVASVIDKKLGGIAKTIKGISKIPIIGGLLDADKILADVQLKAAEIGSTKFDVLKTAVKGVTESLHTSMLEPALLIAEIIKLGSKFIEQATLMGKSLGYATSQADKFRYKIGDIARDSTNINVTTTNLVEAFQDLTESTGFVSEYSQNTLKTQILLTKQVGLTKEEAAQFYRLSALTGQSSENVYKSMIRGVIAIRNQYQVGLPLKATLAEAAKVSGQLASNLRYNPETIAKTVSIIKTMGSSLEDAKNMASSLLNFESSIENELKADLLIGQQLNLQKARELALRGDIAGVVTEITNQGITSVKYSQMNVIAQKALAEAFGLQADALADQLRKREEAIKSGKSLKVITEDEAEEALKRQNIQEKFNASVLKLQDIFGSMVDGPIGQLLDALTDILSTIGYILKPFTLLYNGVSAISKVLFNWIPSLGIIGKIFKGIAATAIIFAAYRAFGAIMAPGLGLGLFTLPLAIAAAAAITGAGMGLLNSQKADDMVSEGGYGKRTLSSPEGTIKLNDKDTIVAGTNLFDDKKQSINSTIDFTPMIKAINEVRQSIDKLYNKEGTVTIDGRKLGTLLVQGSYKTA